MTVAYSYDAGTTSPVRAGLAEIGGIRVNDGTFKTSTLPIIEGSPPVRVPVTALPSDYGGWAGTQYYEHWPFTLAGWIYIPGDPDSIPSAIDQLKGALQVAGLQPLVYNARGWTARRQLNVLLDGQITITPRDGSRRIPTMDFSVPLLAPDPIAVNADTTNTVTIAAGGTGTATNNGNTGAYFTWTITGPVTDPNLRIGTLHIDLTGVTVASGDVWTVDTNPVTGLTVVDGTGTNKYGSVVDWELFRIPVGSSTLHLAGSGAGSSTVTFRDSFV